MIRRKHVGSHRREAPALRGRLKRIGDAQMRQEGGKMRKGNVRRMKGNAQMRQEGGKKRKGNVRKMKGNVRRMKGNGPTKRLNVPQRKRVDV